MKNIESTIKFNLITQHACSQRNSNIHMTRKKWFEQKNQKTVNQQNQNQLLQPTVTTNCVKSS